MSFIDERVQDLVDGVEGSIVIEKIKKYYGTYYSFEKNTSNVRRAFLEKNIRHDMYNTDMKTLKNSIQSQSDMDKYTLLENSNLTIQYDTQKKIECHAFFENIETNNLFAKLKLIPDNMKSYAIEKNDQKISKEKKMSSLLKRNETKIEIFNTEQILQDQIFIIKNGCSSKIKEIIALLFVSGRRETEILNGKSKFEEIHNRPFHVRFTGALKRKRDLISVPDTCIEIPLLCKAEFFIQALQTMRSKQSDDIMNLTNKQVSQRYCSQINTACKKIFPMLTKPHDIRGIYAKIVDVKFKHTASFPKVCMYCLGHDIIQDSLHYMVFELNDLVYDTNYGYLFDTE